MLSKYTKESNPFGYISDITGSSLTNKPLSNWKLVILPTSDVVGKIDVHAVFHQEQSTPSEDFENITKSNEFKTESILKRKQSNGNF